MKDVLLAVYAFNLWCIQGVVKDIADEQMLVRPSPEANSALWSLGHLAVSTDYAAQTLGMPAVLPARWHEWFGMKSDPAILAALSPTERPTRADLLVALEAGHIRVEDALRQADAAALAKPMPADMFGSTPLKTVVAVLAFQITSHEGFHLAQLSAVRRSLGFKPFA